MSSEYPHTEDTVCAQRVWANPEGLVGAVQTRKLELEQPKKFSGEVF